MWSLSDIQQLIRSESLFRPGQFLGVDYDSLLERRDRNPFDPLWTEAQRRVAAAWRRLPDETARAEEITAVREYVFRHVFRMTGQHDDMAAYTSDDFGLICEAAVSGCWPDAVVALADYYKRQELPEVL